MRILICSFTFAPDKNGVAAVVLEHALHFARSGHEVTVFSGQPVSGIEDDTVYPFAVRRFRVQGNGHLKSRIRGEASEYVEAFREWNGDVAFLHCWCIWSTDLLLSHLRTVPFKVVMVSHGFDAQRYPRGMRFPRGMRHWLGWWPYVLKLPFFIRRFSALVVLSRSDDPRWYFDHKVAILTRYPRVEVIPSGVNLMEFRERGADFREAHNLTGKFVFLTVGNYFPLHKNQELALRAFAASGIENGWFVCIGSQSNDYSAYLEKLADELGCAGRFLCLSGLSRAEVVAAYQSCDVVVCSSIWESGPIVLLEAMAAEKPFISTDVGFARTLPGGIIIGELAEMARAMIRLHSEPPLRNTLAKAGFRYCQENHDWPSVMARYDKVLKEMVGGST